MSRIVSLVLLAVPTVLLAADRAPDPRPAPQLRLGAPGYVTPPCTAHILMPDGLTVLSASLGELIFTSLATGFETKRVPLEKVNRKFFDRMPRSATLLAGGKRVYLNYDDHSDRAAGVYDIETGKVLFTFDSYVYTLSGDGSRAVVMHAEGDAKQSVRVIESANGKVLSEFKSPKLDIRGAGISADDTRVALFRFDTKDVQIVDATGRELTRFPAEVGYGMWQVIFSPDGKTLYGASHVGPVRAWDITTGKPQREFATKGEGGADKIVLSADGSRLGAINSDFYTRQPRHFFVWNTKTGEQLATGDLGAVGADLLLPTGKPAVALGVHLVVGDPVRKFVAATLPGEPLTPTGGHLRSISTIHFTPDGKHALTADGGQRVVKWDALTGKELGRVTGSGTDGLDASDCVFRPDGESIAFTTHSSIKTLNLTNAAKASFGLDSWLRIGGWSSDGCRLLIHTASAGTVFDTTTQKPVGTIRMGPESEFALMPDGKTVVTLTPVPAPEPGRTEFEFVATDVATGKKLASSRGPGSTRSWLTPLADNRTVVATFGEHSGAAWDAVTGKQLRWFKHAPMAVSADGKLVVLAVAEALPRPGDLKRVWEWWGGLLAERRGRGCGYREQQPYRTRLLVVEWDTGATRFEVPNNRQGAPPMAFSADGKTLAVVEPTGTTVSLWDVSKR